MHRALDTFFNLFESDKKDVKPDLEKVTAEVANMCTSEEAMYDFSFRDLVDKVKEINGQTFGQVYKAWYDAQKADKIEWGAEDVLALNQMLLKNVCIMGKSLAKYLKRNINISSFTANVAQSTYSSTDQLSQSAENDAINSLIAGINPVFSEDEASRFRQRQQTSINK